MTIDGLLIGADKDVLAIWRNDVVREPIQLLPTCCGEVEQCFCHFPRLVGTTQNLLAIV